MTHWGLMALSAADGLGRAERPVAAAWSCIVTSSTGESWWRNKRRMLQQ